ncbi:hypothetical protein SDC9_199670 [bioreactor metagenome]|uniref:Uncharacterized protein n=1 Tax=bioreactor metagenome TaxID=1076179 RepID=A0A645IL41_9ZZZZ
MHQSNNLFIAIIKKQRHAIRIKRNKGCSGRICYQAIVSYDITFPGKAFTSVIFTYNLYFIIMNLIGKNQASLININRTT